MAGRLVVVEGDITRQDVDAIVNAANSALLPGGGVSGAIHRAAGPELEQASRRVAPCPEGEARLTRGYNLPARWVIHAVGPVWQGGAAGEDLVLARCYRSSLELAARHGLRTIAFPAISTGIFGYPPDRAARVAVRAIREFLHRDTTLEEVRLMAWGDEARRTLEAAVAAAAETEQPS